ncbi:histidine ammonia-lyase [Natronorarus salvus]|uniref:histidine ammonia-lyase n=1 Tax=Natronorarus salvus TaxID=3117733 RepID=UPI002F26AC02
MQTDEPSDEVVADGESLTPADVERVARDDLLVVVPEESKERVRRSRERVEAVLETDEVVYGLNTGFGDLVDTRVPREDLDRLQENLVRSHASGAGRELSREEVRAMTLARVNALVTGYSGIREVVVDRLVTMLNEGIHPVVRSRGSLGASGDLAPLAGMALVLIGEGEADVDGERLPGDDALATAGVEPVSLAPKEGLALINGTQLVVGLAALCLRDAERVVGTADVAGAFTTEVTMGTTAACDPMLSAVRPHPGQARSAKNVKAVTRNSEVVESHRNCDRVQDAYSVRCLPQVHGAVREALDHLREAVEIELNSATDNPLIFDAADVSDRASGTERVGVLSGGNFHAEVLALRLDYLAGALTELAAVTERRVDRLLNPNHQEAYLPPFLARDGGLESGLMIAQYTAAALLNECRAEGRPASDSTPVSGGQEDHVSMGATSAFAARRVTERVGAIVGIELLCAAEAAEYVDDDLSFGDGTKAVYGCVREHVDPLSGDRPLHDDVETLASLAREGVVVDAAERAVGESLSP